MIFFFQGRETYIYNYDHLGRVTDMILPTGEKVKLTSDLSTDEVGLSVKVAAPLQALKRGDKQRFMEFKMRNERSKILTITDGTSYTPTLFVIIIIIIAPPFFFFFFFFPDRKTLHLHHAWWWVRISAAASNDKFSITDFRTRSTELIYLSFLSDTTLTNTYFTPAALSFFNAARVNCFSRFVSFTKI